MRFFSRVHRHGVAHLSKGVSKSLQLLYDMAGTSASSLQLDYDIRNAVSDTLVLLYDIPLVFVSDTLELIYNTRPPLFFGYNLGTFTAVPSNDMGDFIA